MKADELYLPLQQLVLHSEDSGNQRAWFAAPMLFEQLSSTIMGVFGKACRMCINMVN